METTHTRSWKIYAVLSLAVHGFCLALFFLLGLDWRMPPPLQNPALQVGFLSESQVIDAARRSSDGGQGDADDATVPSQMNHAASPSATSMLPSIRAAAAPSIPELNRIIPPASTSASATAAGAQSASGSSAATSVAPNDGSIGSAVSTNGGAAADNAPAGGLGAGFSANGDGSYTATSGTGLSYRILQDAEAHYPEEARALGYASTVPVTGRVLVGTDGNIESVHILTDAPNLGFRQAAEEAFWGMRFAPIVYQGHPIKLWFEKTLIFQP